MIVRSIPDMGTQQAELMSGGIHWMYNVKKDVGESMAKNDRINYQLGPSLRIGFLVLDAAGFTGDGHPITEKSSCQGKYQLVVRMLSIQLQ